jgi:AcrR family transcriptional regulator
MSADQHDPSAGPDTRTRILDATEQIMLEEGYAGVSSRKVAAKAGLKSNILHYYFRTMDELFIAAFQRREDWHVARFAGAAASSKPLHALWELGVDAASSKLNLEFVALACHRPAIRETIARSAGRDRITVAAALESVFSRYGIDPKQYPPRVVAMAMAGMARALATERALGTEDGHAEALEFVGHLLGILEVGEQQAETPKSVAPKGPIVAEKKSQGSASAQVPAQQQEITTPSIDEMDLEHLTIEGPEQ